MNKKLFALAAVVLLLTSCASIINGSKAKVTLKSNYVTQPVNLRYDDQVETDVFLPYTIKVKRGFKPTEIYASTQGYEDAKVTVDKKFNTISVWNILVGGIPGFAIDAATGAMMKPKQKEYEIPFIQANAQKEVPQTRKQEPERVSRENAGSTSMEKTIVRWYFDSDPQGARIFWRVISSVPEEVKNTNELWLGSTPFEETRSFNIQGLTYENSGDVQIEIKVKRKGYMDQSKRFNVRQALDQQEISSFFELVKDVE